MRYPLEILTDYIMQYDIRSSTTLAICIMKYKLFCRRELVFKKQGGRVEESIKPEQQYSIARYDTVSKLPNSLVRQISNEKQYSWDNLQDALMKGGQLWCYFRGEHLLSFFATTDGKYIKDSPLVYKKGDGVISHAYTIPEFRNKGFFYRFIVLVAEQFKGSHLFATCLDWNVASIKVFSKLGFKFIGYLYNNRSFEYREDSNLPWLK